MKEKFLNLLLDFISQRKQRTKRKSFSGNCRDITCGIPQGSISGPLLCNIFINNIFLCISKKEINFADDKSIYSCGDGANITLEDLKHDPSGILKWRKSNSLKAIPGKL